MNKLYFVFFLISILVFNLVLWVWANPNIQDMTKEIKKFNYLLDECKCNELIKAIKGVDIMPSYIFVTNSSSLNNSMPS